MSSTSSGRTLHENLDTTSVNLWSLLRSLTQRGFVGRVRVDMEDCVADVFLSGSRPPLVREVDRRTGRETLEEAALHRLVLRTRETPGTITVFEGTAEAVAFQNRASATRKGMEFALKGPEKAAPETDRTTDTRQTSSGGPPAVNRTPDEILAPPQAPLRARGSENQNSWVMTLGVELIGAAARGINAAGEDFDSLFHDVRLELADDYSFLDPMANALFYADGAASVSRDIPASIFVSGLSEALRRVVDRVAVGDRKRRVRERVALEFLGVARTQREALENSGFRPQLDRIAGTKVV